MTTINASHYTTEQRQSLLQSAGQRYFSVSFIKKDNTVREMLVKRFEKQAMTDKSGKAVGVNTSEGNMNIFTGVCQEKKAFRKVTLDKLIKVKINGTEYTF